MDLETSLPEKPLTIKSVPTLWQIASEVAHKHGLTLRLLRGNRRLGPISAARFEYYYRAANETNKSLCEIGRCVEVDHSSVSYGLTRYGLQHNLTPPRGMCWDGVAIKASKCWRYPLDLYRCGDGALRNVQYADRGLRG